VVQRPFTLSDEKLSPNAINTSLISLKRTVCTLVHKVSISLQALLAV